MKDATEITANRFSDVINASLDKGVFPTNWKMSTIIPVSKVIGTIKCEEYRPINIVPIYEKILELAVKEQMIEHCERSNLFADDQSAFRSKHLWKPHIEDC